MASREDRNILIHYLDAEDIDTFMTTNDRN
jgi:hypothetical protein